MKPTCNGVRKGDLSTNRHAEQSPVRLQPVCMPIDPGTAYLDGAPAPMDIDGPPPEPRANRPHKFEGIRVRPAAPLTQDLKRRRTCPELPRPGHARNLRQTTASADHAGFPQLRLIPNAARIVSRATVNRDVRSKTSAEAVVTRTIFTSGPTLRHPVLRRRNRILAAAIRIERGGRSTSNRP